LTAARSTQPRPSSQLQLSVPKMSF